MRVDFYLHFRMLAWFLFFLGGSILHTPLALDTIAIQKNDPYRLPSSVLPEHYAISIIVEENFHQKGIFTGSVAINLNVVQDLEEIILHANGLEIDENKIQVTCGNTSELFESLTNNTDYHKLIIKAKSLIPAGTSCILKFEDYEGVLLDDMIGFYRSWYQDENGEIE